MYTKFEITQCKFDDLKKNIQKSLTYATNDDIWFKGYGSNSGCVFGDIDIDPWHILFCCNTSISMNMIMGHNRLSFMKFERFWLVHTYATILYENRCRALWACLRVDEQTCYGEAAVIWKYVIHSLINKVLHAGPICKKKLERSAYTTSYTMHILYILYKIWSKTLQNGNCPLRCLTRLILNNTLKGGLNLHYFICTKW